MKGTLCFRVKVLDCHAVWSGLIPYKAAQIPCYLYRTCGDRPRPSMLSCRPIYVYVITLPMYSVPM